MEGDKVLLEKIQFGLTIQRLCHQVLEKYDDLSDFCILGIQPKGTMLSDRIYKGLLQLTGLPSLDYGKIDITFFRDDFRLYEKPLTPHPNDINFITKGKKVLLIDDVLYTGRSIHAALASMQQYGRPEIVELMVLVDRRFNRHLPIQADYIGIAIDTLDEAYVKVFWEENSGEDKILLYDRK